MGGWKGRVGCTRSGCVEGEVVTRYGSVEMEGGCVRCGCEEREGGVYSMRVCGRGGRGVLDVGVGKGVYSMWVWGRGGRSVLDAGVGKGREGCTQCGCREGEGGLYSVWV